MHCLLSIPTSLYSNLCSFVLHVDPYLFFALLEVVDWFYLGKERLVVGNIYQFYEKGLFGGLSVVFLIHALREKIEDISLVNISVRVFEGDFVYHVACLSIYILGLYLPQGTLPRQSVHIGIKENLSFPFVCFI